MELTKTSAITGNKNTRDVNCDEKTFEAAHEEWLAGAMIQDAFHMLDADDREFIKTGITPEEWDACMGEE